MDDSVYYHPQGAKAIRRLEQLAKLMDSQFRIPGTQIRFGLDPIIGLIPFAGDGITLIIQAGMVITMRQYGASGKVMTLMVLNILIDYVIGIVPFVGDALDVFYKSNNKNVRLLKEHYQEGKHQGSGRGIVVFIIILIILIIALGIFLIVKFFQWVGGFF